MLLTLKYNLKNMNNKKQAILQDLMWHTAKVYNTLLYEIENKERILNLNKSLNILSSSIYKEYRVSNWHSEYLHSHMLQEAIINAISNYKSYVKLNEKYTKDKTSLKGKPNKPRYKNEKSTKEIVFTKYAIRQKGNLLMLSLSKKIQEKYEVKSLNFLIPRKLKKLADFSRIKMIKVIYKKETYEMNIIYEKEVLEKQKEKVKQMTNICAIDLGLNNIVAITNKENNKTLLISGKEAKSKNRYIQEKISKLQQINMYMIKESKKHKNTKQINRLYEYRRNYMNTYMHKVSKMVIEYAKENKCKEIVIGDIKGIKEKMNYNKNFVQIPLHSLVEKIKYKAELEGIEIKEISERYTSGVSAIDKEEIIKENYNKKRRITRGLFITNEGKKINADINGSLNILRKYINKSIPNQEIAMDNGREQRPIKKRVA